MRYTILSIDESRLEKKNAIRSTLSGWEEFKLDCVNGYEPGALKAAKLLTGIDSVPMLAGELGVWYSVVKSWIDVANNGPAVVFEDDALLKDNFVSVFESAVRDLPEDADFLSLFIPYNQVQDYYYLVEYDSDGCPRIIATGLPESRSLFRIDSENIAKAYQGYGNVCVYYTRRGAIKLLNIAKARGTYTPVDCFLFLQTHAGEVNGYSLHPQHHGVVDVDWQAPTLVHNGPIIGDE